MSVELNFNRIPEFRVWNPEPERLVESESWTPEYERQTEMPTIRDIADYIHAQVGGAGGANRARSGGAALSGGRFVAASSKGHARDRAR